jgi:hypothetical protein
MSANKQEIIVPIMYAIADGNCVYDFEEMKRHFENDLINLSLREHKLKAEEFCHNFNLNK